MTNVAPPALAQRVSDETSFARKASDSSLRATSVLSVSLCCMKGSEITTETQRAQRLHREAFESGLSGKAREL